MWLVIQGQVSLSRLLNLVQIMQHVSDLHLWTHELIALIPFVLPGCHFLHELLVLLSDLSE